MSGEEHQVAAPYPYGFKQAVKPESVYTKYCQHEADPPVCYCVHDWRIEWGNLARAET